MARGGHRQKQSRPEDALYTQAVRATRGGPLFNAFPYPTKISPEAIALFIAVHTAPGQTIMDCFAGSGTTGLGAILAASPTEAMLKEAQRLGLNPQWGEREAHLFELGVLGSFVGNVLCNPPEPSEFYEAAERLLADAERQYSWLYEAEDDEGRTGAIRYIVWADVLRCPKCKKHVTFWDAYVRRRPAEIGDRFRCPKCRRTSEPAAVKRVMRSQRDEFLGDDLRLRYRQPAWVYGSTNGRSWSRPPNRKDLQLLGRIDSQSTAARPPVVRMPWGDLYRTGYHEGMTHMHHFYTKRNLAVFSHLWTETEKYVGELRDALQFLLLSYNASHATLMTRVVAKKNQDDLVVTSGQPGVLYVSGLPVEKNLFSGIRRKLRTIHNAFRTTYRKGGLVHVHNRSCLNTGLARKSVDYVFTDPPFGGNIPYSEVNFLNEAWLGRVTDVSEEAIVSRHQKKDLEQYTSLLSGAFTEASRVLQPMGKVTVVFHSSSAKVWRSLQQACENGGFKVATTSVLDKTQGSFKQITAAGSVQGDPVMLLEKTNVPMARDCTDVWLVTERLINDARDSPDPKEATPQRMYSRLLAYYLKAHSEVPIDASEFYRQFSRRYLCDGELCK